MKIIQLSTFFHPSVGGVERQVEEIAYHLTQLGHEVEVFTTDATHGKEKRMQRLDDQYRGLKIRRFPFLFSLGRFLRFSPGLIWRLWRTDFDIVHVHNLHDGHLLPALIIKSLKRKKLVLTGHNTFVVSDEKRGKALNKGVVFFEKVLALPFFRNKIDRYVALLESEKQSVITKIGVKPEKVVVVPNGIQDIYYTQSGDADFFFREWEIDPTKWRLIVGTASRINFVKGIHNLVQAVQDLPEVLFVFAGGDDGYLGQIKKLFAKYDNVIITEHYLSSDELMNFYQAIDIFLLPSVYEPFGMTLAEAMAQGKMALATTKGGPAEILPPEAGELIEPADEQAWSERIAFYAQNRDLTKVKGDFAKGVAEQYRWQRVIGMLEGVYVGLKHKT